MCSEGLRMWKTTVSTEKMIRTLVTKHPVLLLLLVQLLQPLIPDREYLRVSRENRDEYDEILAGFYGKGPTRSYTKEKFEKFSIIAPGRPLSDSSYCDDIIKERNVQHRLNCMTEHYFVIMEYSEMQTLCYSKYAPCKNGVKKCNRSRRLVDGLYCKLTGEAKLPDCKYESVERRGYVLFTCRWQDDIKKLVPKKINDIMVPSRR
uniref:inactive ribonuclease-like protein 9 n=1 Tax=Ictidomys tridecemlineatus TaxID=43179 RepID=UPI001A9FD4E5|nr:inactive ribonuclease-like protein 9 [Ictidomys tridecemlineatus]